MQGAMISNPGLSVVDGVETPASRRNRLNAPGACPLADPQCGGIPQTLEAVGEGRLVARLRAAAGIVQFRRSADFGPAEEALAWRRAFMNVAAALREFLPGVRSAPSIAPSQGPTMGAADLAKLEPHRAAPVH